MSPEPDMLADIKFESISKVISPEPDIAVLNLSDFIFVLPTMSPEPDMETELIVSTGTVIRISDFQLLLLRLIPFSVLMTNFPSLTSVIIYSKRFSSPCSVISPSLPETISTSNQPETAIPS